MADNKGIFLAEEEKEMAKALDDAFDFENKIVEAGDGLAFRVAIVVVDDYGIEKLDDQYKVKLAIVKDSIFNKEWFDAAMGVWELALEIMKSKKITD